MADKKQWGEMNRKEKKTVLIVLAVVGAALVAIIAASMGGGSADAPNNSRNVGTLPTVNEADYIGKEGLVTFKDLAGKGYTVTAKYVNDAAPKTNRELTDEFANANVNSCQDRLGWDAYVVSDIKQNGDSVEVVTTIKPNDNQECPAGTSD